MGSMVMLEVESWVNFVASEGSRYVRMLDIQRVMILASRGIY